MKQVSVESADLESCLNEAQRGRVVITRRGRPLALLVGVKGLDREQLDLGSDDEFWRLIQQRRRQKSVTRAQIEQKLRKAR